MATTAGSWRGNRDHGWMAWKPPPSMWRRWSGSGFPPRFSRFRLDFPRKMVYNAKTAEHFPVPPLHRGVAHGAAVYLYVPYLALPPLENGFAILPSRYIRASLHLVPFLHKYISRCGAVGSALGLGACLARNAEILRKSRKAFNGADFLHFIKTQNRVEFAFDHSLSHFHAKTAKN